jgi:hypothetical protein
MPEKAPTTVNPDHEPGLMVADAILDFIGHVPGTDEHESPAPAERARTIANRAAIKAVLTAGSLALPPGPFGWLTVLPELIAVWKLQAQMVADISGIYGKAAYLTREQMIYCLFRHSAAQVVRDLAVRVGERFLVQRLSRSAMQALAQQIGIRITQRAIGKSVSRWLPVVGALGVGAYAYYDTGQVAETAIELLEEEIEVVGPGGV